MIVKIIYEQEDYDNLESIGYYDAEVICIIPCDDNPEIVYVKINDNPSPCKVNRKKGRIYIMNDNGKIIEAFYLDWK
jgi:hypothetical protein